jgi:tetratricopeptide (TPR) repeat protein
MNKNKMILHESDLSSFGELLKSFRKRERLTQQQIGDALGVHRHAVGRWEQGDFLPATKAMVLELAKQLSLDEQETRQLLEASLTALAPHWSIPLPRNPYFTGREEILEALHKQLGVEQAVAITQSSALHGLGGIGKTQIALEYTYRHALEYSAVFWIGAETEEQIIASLLHVAETLQLPERAEKDQQRVLTAVQRWLSTHSQWLLIWDNMEDLRVLDRFLPSVRSGAILITTRCQTLGTLARGIDLVPMEPEEAMLFLLRRAKLLSPEATCEDIRHLAQSRPTEHAVASELVAVLGGLPLALDQAGAYLEATRCSLPAYLDLFRVRRATLLQLRGEGARDHPASVSTTFTLSLTATIQRHPAVRDLLCVCSLLQPDAIPEELFRQGGEHLGSALAPVCSDPLEWNRLLGVACSYSLLARQPETSTLSLHRLVQVVLLDAMSEQERIQWQQRTIHALSAVFPEATHEAWTLGERYLSHVLTCASAIQDQDADQELIEVLSKAASYLIERALYEQAERLYERILRIQRQRLGPAHPDMARSLTGLANLYHYQGKKYQQAEVLYLQAVRIQEQALGPMHPDLARSLSDLAYFYNTQGKYQQAKLLYQQAVRIQEQVLGPTHPDLALAINGLAATFMCLGKYAQAESLCQRSLHIREQAFRPEHNEVARSLHNLALISKKQGKYQQAQALYERALYVWEPEHPNAATSLWGLADLYCEQGKAEQAEPLYERALHIWEQVLGPEHTSVAHALDGLAEVSLSKKRYRQAEALYERALRIRQQALGSEYFWTASSLNGLARLYCELGKYEQAEALYMQSLHILEQFVGQQHPDTAQTLHDLALLRQKQSNLNEAISLAERVLSIRSQSLGDAHHKTVASRALCAQLLQEQARVEGKAASERRLEALPAPCENERHEDGASSPLHEAVAPVPSEDDPLQEFLNACCELHPLAWCRISELRHGYEQWTASVQKRVPLSRRDFAAQIKARGCRADRTNKMRIWCGIRLVSKIP